MDPGSKGRKQVEDVGTLDPRIEQAGMFAALFAGSGLGGRLLGLLGRAGPAIAGLLTAGGAALAGLSWPVWAGIAAVASVPALLSMYNGIKEDFSTDLKDLEEAVNDALADNPGGMEANLLNQMKRTISQITTQQRVLESSKDPEAIAQAMVKIEKLLGQLRGHTNQFSASSGSWMPDFLASFLSSINDRMSNLEESWAEFMESVGSAAKQRMSAAQQRPQSGAPGGTAHAPHTIPGAAKTRSPAEESERIRGMQQFLNRLPNSVTGLDEGESLDENGIMDGLTRFVLDHFADHIATDLGVNNISGTRLEQEGSNRSLRRIWEIYKKPWLYQK